MELHVMGAVNGELVCTIVAQCNWTIRRLKVEITNVQGTPVSCQSLILADRKVDDREVLGDIFVAAGSSSVCGDVCNCVSLVQLPPVLKHAQARAYQSLSVTSDAGTGISVVQWTADARKLRSKSNQIVSPTFEVDFGHHFGGMEFKLMICSSEGTFQKSSGCGRVHLKSTSTLLSGVGCISFYICIGRAELGPFFHDFGANSLASLPQDLDAIELMTATKMETMTLDVYVRMECTNF